MAKLLSVWGVLSTVVGRETWLPLAPAFSYAGGVLVCEKSMEYGVCGVLTFLPRAASEDTREGCSGHSSWLLAPHVTLAARTWLDSVSEREALFLECLCMLAFMSLKEHSSHRALLSNQVHQSTVGLGGEERPSDSDFAQTKLSLVSKDREEHPWLIRSDLPPAICRAVQMGEFLWQQKQSKGSTLVC